MLESIFVFEKLENLEKFYGLVGRYGNCDIEVHLKCMFDEK